MTEIVNANSLSLKELANTPTMKRNFEQILGKRAPQFISSVLTLVNNNYDLKKIAPISILNAAKIAAVLNLPINPNLGYMYIVPYNHTAQAQIGYKGLIQLAQRSGQYKHLNAVPVYEDEFKGFNPLTETIDYEPHFKNRANNEKPVGYVGYFELLNGFNKTVYWTREQIDAHRRKFSKMSGGATPKGVWADNFDAMALKTVLKNLLSKWGPLSTEMEYAYSKADEDTISDNAEVKEVDATEEDNNSVDALLDDAEVTKKEVSKDEPTSEQADLFDGR